jgi:hypothetical protein
MRFSCSLAPGDMAHAIGVNSPATKTVLMLNVL